jgi:hypothetical protein
MRVAFRQELNHFHLHFSPFRQLCSRRQTIAPFLTFPVTPTAII